VAGFGEDEIDVELKENSLIVKGTKAKKEQDSETEYVHKGISTRGFERNFTLADNVEVRAATVQNGILAIALEQIVPEENKPKKIQITYTK
jgi:molecular chaperone IbpA